MSPESLDPVGKWEKISIFHDNILDKKDYLFGAHLAEIPITCGKVGTADNDCFSANKVAIFEMNF